MSPYRKKFTFITILSVFGALAIFAGYHLIDEYYSNKITLAHRKNLKLYAKNNTINPRINEILSLIADSYVDNINTKNLKKNSIQDILNSLDPHSDYLSPQEVKSLNLSLGGSFGGIGVEYYILNDTLLVTNVTPNSPAEKAGLKTGDKIINVGALQVSGKGLPKAEMTGKIKGANGTSISLNVMGTNKNLKKIVLIRKNISVSSLEASYLIKHEIGYIKISNFGENTNSDFLKALNHLKTAGMKKLILDLRDNSGGYFDAAVALADQFFTENKLIVYTKGAHIPRSDYISSGDGKFKTGDLVVLIDENTASASEVVAGAIKDLKRGTIIGRRSFGKGLVQEQFEFKDGAALNLTVARYYTPSGKSIQKPYKAGEKSEYEKDIDKRFENGELSSNETDSLNQKNEGGISPDIYIKLQTGGYNSFYAKLVNDNIISNFTYDVLVKKYSKEKIKNIYQFEISEDDFQQLIAYAKRKGVKPSKLNYSSDSKSLIKNNISELLARFYFGAPGYYINTNSRDSSIKKALKVLD